MVTYNERLGKDVLYLGTGDKDKSAIIGSNEAISVENIVSGILEGNNFYEHKWQEGDMLLWDND
jgi:hypothetical protein